MKEVQKVQPEVDERSMSASECRGLILTRLQNMPYNHPIASSEGNIVAHHRQFAGQLGWPRLNRSDAPTDYQRPRRMGPEERDTGRRIRALGKLGVFWDFGDICFIKRPAETTSLRWSMAQCMAAPQPNRDAVLAAEKQFSVAAAAPAPASSGKLKALELEDLGGLF